MTIFTGEQFFRDTRYPFHIELYTIGKDEQVPSHTHDFVELVLVVSGSAEHEVADKPYTLQAGDVFVIEPNIYHSFAGNGFSEAKVYNVLFDAAFLRKELDSLLMMSSFVRFFYLLPFLRRNTSFVPYQFLSEDEKASIEMQLRGIEEEYTQARDGWELLVKTRLIETLVWLSRYFKASPPLPEPDVSDQAWIASVCHFIEQHFRQNLTLPQLCQLCGMSVSAFTAKFKEATGRTTMDYKHEVQIRHACRLLASTDRKIADIALDSGFNDISFFNKIFRKHCGMSPKEYRLSR